MSFTIEQGRWKYYLCPDCVKEEVARDPRKVDPNAVVINQPCYSHLTIRGEIHPFLIRPTENPTEKHQ